MSGDWILRPATAQDVAQLHRLELELFPGDSWSEQMLHAEITHETRRYLIAAAPGSEQILGYAGVMVVADTADVQNIAVVPEARGKGLGSALLSALHEIARERGAREILLEVRESNATAQSLYRRFGYQEIAQRPGYYPDGEAAAIMHLELEARRTSSAADLTSHMTTTSTQSDAAEEDPR